MIQTSEPSPVTEAVANLFRVITFLIVGAALIFVFVAFVETVYRCSAWQADFIACDTPGCKPDLARSRPVMCARPK